MSKSWPQVALGEVLRKSEESVPLAPNTTYREVTIKLWGKGVVLRREAFGSEIAAPRRSVVRAGQFILSRIDARNGAFGIVPPALDGAVVSNDFPSFKLNTQRIIPEYLGWLSRTENFVDLCKAASEGTTNRVRLKEERFLATSIALPSLEEQQRIVARIEELESMIEDAWGLRRQATEEAEALVASEEFKLWPPSSLLNAPSLQEVTVFLSRGRQSEQGTSEHYLVKSQHVQMKKYVRTNLTLAAHIAQKVSPDAKVRDKDILIACSAAGCLGRVAYYRGEPDRVVSTDTHVAIARANPEKILPDYLFAYLSGAQGQIQLRSREKGDWTREKIEFRLTELNVADMRKVPVPLPLLSDQRRIVIYLDSLHSKLNLLKHLQGETAIELDAMLPSILAKAFQGTL